MEAKGFSEWSNHEDRIEAIEKEIGEIGKRYQERRSSTAPPVFAVDFALALGLGLARLMLVMAVLIVCTFMLVDTHRHRAAAHDALEAAEHERSQNENIMAHEKILAKLIDRIHGAEQRAEQRVAQVEEYQRDHFERRLDAIDARQHGIGRGRCIEVTAWDAQVKRLEALEKRVTEHRCPCQAITTTCGGGGWSRLAPGVSGQILTVDAVGSMPVWTSR